MFQVEISKCRYTLQGIDTSLLWPTPSMQVEEGPILVEELDNHEYYVHDGRHRLIRAQLKGKALIDADWYADWLADQEAAAIKKALAGPFGKPVGVAYQDVPAEKRVPVNNEDAPTIELVEKNLRYHYAPTGGNSYPSFSDVRRNTNMPPYDAHVLSAQSSFRKAVLNALDKAIHKSACGREHLHEPHAFGEHMETFCSGQPW